MYKLPSKTARDRVSVIPVLLIAAFLFKYQTRGTLPGASAFGISLFIAGKLLRKGNWRL